jgi:hypothetical protein
VDRSNATKPDGMRRQSNRDGVLDDVRNMIVLEMAFWALDGQRDTRRSSNEARPQQTVSCMT